MAAYRVKLMIILTNLLVTHLLELKREKTIPFVEEIILILGSNQPSLDDYKKLRDLIPEPESESIED